MTRGRLITIRYCKLLKKADIQERRVMLMTTYETLMIILTVALLIVEILKYVRNKK
jgi:hypothetical protein